MQLAGSQMKMHFNMKYILVLITWLTTVSAYGQQVAQIKRYSYADTWELKKGDSLLLLKPDSSIFTSISDSPKRNAKSFLDSTAGGKYVRIKEIKRYVWNSEENVVFCLVDFNGKGYYLDLHSAIESDEIATPANLPLFINSRKQYLAPNGIIYKVGDLIELGRGSNSNGYFNYLRIGGWAVFALGMQDPIGPVYAGQKVKIKTITYQKSKKRGFTKVWMEVGGGNITSYTLDIDNAVASCEVIPCKTSKQSNISVADELMKLKKLKDEGILSEEEFNEQKKKILN